MVSVAKWKEAEQFQNPQVPLPFRCTHKQAISHCSQALVSQGRLGVTVPPTLTFFQACCCHPSRASYTWFLSRYSLQEIGFKLLSRLELEAAPSSFRELGFQEPSAFWSSFPRSQQCPKGPAVGVQGGPLPFMGTSATSWAAQAVQHLQACFFFPCRHYSCISNPAL